ncbi:MAG TPA: hypothetical protein VGL41_10130 [Roseiarcus sp.]|jgi:hypothetical protein
MNTFEKGGAATIATTSAPTASTTRHDRKMRGSDVCRRALGVILEANLAHLDALTHGFIPARLRR